MTEVRFILNVPDKISYACRIARKAFMQAQPMAIVAQQSVLQQLDQLLWTMSPSDFVAHACLNSDGQEMTAANQGSAAALGSALEVGAESPIMLLPQAGLSPHSQTLLNLLPEVPSDFGRFAVLYELIAQNDEADKQQGRQRWRYYRQRGYVLNSHDLANRGSRT